MVKRTTIWAHPTNFYVGRLKPVAYIVIHSGETGEGSTPAEGMGNWFAQDHGAGGRSSAHVGADTDSICRYVKDTNTAFGAPNVNATGFHIELAGRAGQTSAQWDDADSRLILANGALAAAEASQRLGIPARWLSDDQLRAGNVKGFITHAQASRVLGGSHWDPGPNFPAAKFMSLVKSHLTSAAPEVAAAPAPKEWDEMASKDEIRAVVREEVEHANDLWGYRIVGPDGKFTASAGAWLAYANDKAGRAARDAASALAVVKALAAKPQGLTAAEIEAAAKAGAASALDERIESATVHLDVKETA